MSSDASSLSRVFAAPTWLVVVLMLVAIVAVGLGPERYAGVDGDLIQWAILGAFALYALGGSALSGGTEVETDPETPATVGEHYRPTEGGVEAGVYRVVGADGEVALLRVGDENGRRVTTGEVVHVSQSALDAEFDAASDPDSGASPLAGLRNALSGLFWSVRRLF